MTIARQSAEEGEILPVQVGGREPPFFFLHGTIQESIYYCYPLAQQLGADRPFYAVNPYRLQGPGAPPSLEEIAAQHIADIRTVQPRGPYHLGGFCNGALIAYEMACQLQAAGEHVTRLLLVDPWSPGYRPQLRRGIGRLGAALRWPAERQLIACLRMRHLFKFIQPTREQKFADMHYLASQEPELLLFFPSRSALRHDYSGVFSWVSAVYQPQRFDGATLIIWNKQEKFLFDLWQRQMAHLTDKASVMRAPGSHLTMRTEHVTELASLMRQFLQADKETCPHVND